MFFRVSLAVATFVSAVLAQSGIAFTSVPTSVIAGQTYTITWSGGDNTQPATITLREGDPNNLQTVGTITTSATGGSFQWTPDTTIQNGAQYALEISQGSDINYSGEFSIQGGSSASAASSASSAAASSASSAASSAFSSASSALSSLSSAASASSGSSTASGSSSGSASNSASTSASASKSSSASTSASKTGSSSSSSAAPTSNGAAGFDANQALLALGAVAAAMI